MAQIQYLLNSPIEYLKGVGPFRGDLLKKELNIFTFGDLLQHYPFRYIDRTSFLKINQINPNTQYVQLIGKLVETNVEGELRNKRLKAYIQDETGELELVWFQGLKWVEKELHVGKKYLVFGKPNLFKGEYSIVHPEIALLDHDDEVSVASGRMQPMYPSTEKLKQRALHSKGIEKLIKTLLETVSEKDVSENLSSSILKQNKFPTRYDSFIHIHQPANDQQLEQARARAKFEELFFSQLNILQTKIHRHKSSSGFLFPKLDPIFNQFYKKKLPFELTGAQKNVIKEIRRDVLSGKQMNRLLQGDVGSGKTIVSLLIMLMAIDNHFQAAMMVPTEILSQQHFRNLSAITKGLGLKIELLTASVKNKQRKNILERLKQGDIDLLIGTHSLIEEIVVFSNLGLVIIDEQHRFGVEQRAQLWTKNRRAPHILVMTATPIPRTLAMTLYGDLDVSVIDEMPPGRKSIVTAHRFDSARLRVFGFMKDQIKTGRQIYIVYPLIEESEKLDFKFLMDGYESISRAFPLPEFTISIVHGKMKPDAREFEMQRFIKKETQIMVATTVIEVGVDVPNASVMIVESAERFGLSQLHQLRGRVGRGADQSYCILMTGEKLSAEARRRMSILCETNDGFRIAEEDLQMRGPGDIEGTQQSGIVSFKIAELGKDQKILQAARAEAEKILEKDPHLNSTENIPVKTFFESQKRRVKHYSKIS